MSGPAFSLPVGPPYALHNNGVGVRPPTMPTSAPASVVALQIPLPETQQIPEARDFNVNGFIASAAVETATIANTTVDIPDSNLGVIRSVTFNIANMLTTTDVVWSLLINGVPPQGWSNIPIFPRATPFVGNGYDTCIRVTGAAEIKVIFSNRDGGAYTIGAAVSGWFWPVSADERWRQFGR